ncbi:unnamed protein product [Arabis nemorensis]|uniref:Uncharacterized protein n=1 Tax=Arabis nemorensis TaxID=586526 RepID=A0A565CXD4_9BRAS|nr:unnamed protein product [Arabis nemorensis]
MSKTVHGAAFMFEPILSNLFAKVFYKCARMTKLLKESLVDFPDIQMKESKFAELPFQAIL